MRLIWGVLLAVFPFVEARRYVVQKSEQEVPEGCMIVKTIDVNTFTVDCDDTLDETKFDLVIPDETVAIDLQYKRSSKSFETDVSEMPKYYSWGIDRIYYGHDSEKYPEPTGKGTIYYSVDTGVDRTAKWEFNNRVQRGMDFTGTGMYGNVDCHGHGTHTSSTATGKNFGIATLATIVPVKVLDCKGSGSVSNILLALQWILERKTPRSVVGMSIGFNRNLIVDQKVKELSEAGYIVVASAGNSNLFGTVQSPGGGDYAVSVCATDLHDIRARWSNYGPSVDICAPGVDICAAVPGTPAKFACWDGTSMSQPHVAGVALHLWSKYPKLSSDQIVRKLYDDAFVGIAQWLYPADTNLIVSII